MSKKPWFEVDREGLAEIVKRRGGLAWLIQELISNAWDEKGVTTVDVRIEPIENSPTVELSVVDDSPDGFKDLSHAWTLFAKSEKRGDVSKRGRFNLGEKLVLAFCREASITTTTGSVIFDHRGRTTGRSKRDAGSEFFGIVRMTRDELKQALIDLKRLIPPETITTTINGELLAPREPIHTWQEWLWTEVPDDEGNLHRKVNEADIRTFKPLPGEKPMLYELGIPVVELDGDPVHVDVRQKVPLNLERDNVTPSYLRDIRTAVLNHMHDKLDVEALRGAWALDAMESYDVRKEALEAGITARFGDNRVGADPTDHEAENRLKAEGKTIVAGGSLPGGVWDRVKQHGLIKPAGQVSPTPKPYSEDGKNLNIVDVKTLPDVMQSGVLRYRAVCRVLLGRDITVLCAKDPHWPFGAVWHRGQDLLVINVSKLDADHFESPTSIYSLALHEIAHEFESNHLAEAYHEALCTLGGKLAVACTAGEVADEMRALAGRPQPKKLIAPGMLGENWP